MTKLTPYIILNYFHELLEFNKLTFLKNTAIEEIKVNHAGFIDSFDVENGIIRYWKVFSDQHSQGEPTEGLATYNFYKEHKKELLSQGVKAINAINKLVYSRTEANQPYKAILQNISQEIHYLNLRADKLYPHYKEISNVLESIGNHLFVRYEIIPYSKKKAGDKMSYFGFKDTIPRRTIEELYDLADRLELIEYDVVDEATFMSVLLENPSNPETTIKFNCSNDLVITLLDRLKPYFTSLTPKSI